MSKKDSATQVRCPYTFSGLNFRIAKLLVETLFKEHLVTVKRNETDMCYEAYLKSGADESLMKKVKTGFIAIKFIVLKVN